MADARVHALNAEVLVVSETFARVHALNAEVLTVAQTFARVHALNAEVLVVSVNEGGAVVCIMQDG